MTVCDGCQCLFYLANWSVVFTCVFRGWIAPKRRGLFRSRHCEERVRERKKKKKVQSQIVLVIGNEREGIQSTKQDTERKASRRSGSCVCMYVLIQTRCQLPGTQITAGRVQLRQCAIGWCKAVKSSSRAAPSLLRNPLDVSRFLRGRETGFTSDLLPTKYLLLPLTQFALASCRISVIISYQINSSRDIHLPYL